MKNTEQELTEYLKEKYGPVALILHGSRANGMAREHSDWDFVLVTKQDVNPITREIVSGSNIEVKQIILPVPEDKFLGFFFRTENIKILYDTESAAENLIKQNDLRIKEGNQFDPIDRTKRRAFLLSALDGIHDYSDTPLIVFDKKIDFYTRVVESWFRFMKNEFEPSHYMAFPRIQKEDMDFYILLEEFVAKTESSDLLLSGNKLVRRLFPDIE